MHILHDDDEWEAVTESRPCTACDGHLQKCNGRCNGSFSMSLRRRPWDDVMKIKAERERKRENAVLAEADAIRSRRARP